MDDFDNYGRKMQNGTNTNGTAKVMYGRGPICPELHQKARTGRVEDDQVGVHKVDVHVPADNRDRIQVIGKKGEEYFV